MAPAEINEGQKKIADYHARRMVNVDKRTLAGEYNTHGGIYDTGGI